MTSLKPMPTEEPDITAGGIPTEDLPIPAENEASDTSNRCRLQRSTAGRRAGVPDSDAEDDR